MGVEKPSKEDLALAAMPELAEDRFAINGKPVQIKALKVMYQVQFSKLIKPLADTLSVYSKDIDLEKMHPSDAFTVTAALMENFHLLPKAVQIICHNGGYMIDDETLGNSEITTSEMLSVVMKAWKNGGEQQKMIADFITIALKRGKELMREEAAKLENLLEISPEETITTTASSKPSAKTTHTSGTKSTRN